MQDRELPDDEIEALLDTTKKSSYEIPGTTKRKKFDPELRTVSNWFKLPHLLNKSCEVPSHDEEREARDKPRLYFEIPETKMIVCRWCFIESRDKND